MIPALKRRAKFVPTLRVEDLIRVSFSLWLPAPAPTKVYATALRLAKVKNRVQA